MVIQVGKQGDVNVTVNVRPARAGYLTKDKQEEGVFPETRTGGRMTI